MDYAQKVEHMVKIGYLRGISHDREIKQQLSLMKNQGIDKIFHESVIGKYVKRPEFEKMLKVICEGDYVVVSSLDSLGRDYREIRENASYIKQKKVTLTILDAEFLNFDTGNNLLDTATFDLFYSLLGYLNQNEEKQVQGRPVEYSLESKDPEKRIVCQTIIQLLRNGMSVAKVAEKSGASRPTVYKVKKMNDL